MKVLITNIKDKEERSGLGAYVNDIYRLLKSKNVDVKVLMSSSYLKNYSIPKEDVVNIKFFLNPYLRWLYYLLVVPILVRRYEIVHFTSEDLPIILCKIINIIFRSKNKVVVTIHDLGEFKSRRYSLVKDAFRRIFVPIEAKASDLVFVVSEATANDVENLLRVPREKICVAYKIGRAHV